MDRAIIILAYIVQGMRGATALSISRQSNAMIRLDDIRRSTSIAILCLSKLRRGKPLTVIVLPFCVTRSIVTSISATSDNRVDASFLLRSSADTSEHASTMSVSVIRESSGSSNMFSPQERKGRYYEEDHAKSIKRIIRAHSPAFSRYRGFKFINDYFDGGI